ncbi:MAG TPA: hypothetical protein VFC79_06140 [Tissierellaceae bacterium]|nr:hypothetical protein [Tissierellaceae bacterium]
MCLAAKDLKLEIAEKDMIVYKVVSLRSKNKILSCIRETPYKLGTTYTLSEPLQIIAQPYNDINIWDTKAFRDNHIMYNSIVDTVHKGFHSATTMERLRAYKTIMKCKIPKGSTIVRDNSGLIVSDVLRTLGIYVQIKLVPKPYRIDTKISILHMGETYRYISANVFRKLTKMQTYLKVR